MIRLKNEFNIEQIFAHGYYCDFLISEHSLESEIYNGYSCIVRIGWINEN